MHEDFATKLVEFLPLYAILLLALCVHEAAHAWMAKQCGDLHAMYQGRLTLNPLAHIDPIGTVILPFLQVFSSVPLLCWAKPVPVVEGNLRRRSDMMWVALAGPVSNLILAAWGIVILKLYYIYFQAQLGSGLFQPSDGKILFYLYYFVLINFFLALFNMIPVPPLDGSRIFYYLVVYRSRSRQVEQAWENWERFAFTLFLLLIFTGAFAKVAGPVSGWITRQVSVLM